MIDAEDDARLAKVVEAQGLCACQRISGIFSRDRERVGLFSIGEFSQPNHNILWP
jgi:hypothetical protein